MIFIHYQECHRIRFGIALNSLIKRAWTADVRHYRLKSVGIIEKGEFTLCGTAIISCRRCSFEEGSLVYSPSQSEWIEVTPRTIFDTAMKVLACKPDEDGSKDFSVRDRQVISSSIIEPMSTISREKARMLPSHLIDRLVQMQVLGYVIHKAPSPVVGGS